MLHTYGEAGVNLEAAERVVELIQKHAPATHGPQVLAGVGPFGGLFRLGQYRDPVLVSSTDSVGTKVRIAIAAGRHDTIGEDLVNHCVNDILTAGARPLFFLDYVATSHLVPEQVEAVVTGLARACKAHDCALIGGETAEMPGLYHGEDYDLVGFIVGVVEREELLGPTSITEGDVLLGLPSSGLHTNGYSLVRRIFRVGLEEEPEEERRRLERHYRELGRTLGEELLEPHRSYEAVLRPLLKRVKGLAHITGGGIPGNLSRILPPGLAAQVEEGSWQVPPIFHLIQRAGSVPWHEMYRTFNMGLGMVVVCAVEDAGALAAAMPGAATIGRVVRRASDQPAVTIAARA